MGDRARARRSRHDPGSARNHLLVDVVSVTAVGNRVRVGLAAPQPLTAEISDAAVRELGLAPGARAVASWKAAATRVLPLCSPDGVEDQLVKQRLRGERGQRPA